jgi:hypothetical protein
MLPHGRQKGLLDFIASRVSCVKDSTPRVSTFSVEMKMAVPLPVEFGSEVNELLYPLRPLTHNELYNVAFAEATTAHQGILNMKLKRIIGLVDCRDPALRP